MADSYEGYHQSTAKEDYKAHRYANLVLDVKWKVLKQDTGTNTVQQSKQYKVIENINVHEWHHRFDEVGTESRMGEYCSVLTSHCG